MNAHVSVDCGFVRVPTSYLELPISPGAKVLLLHLCAAANEHGESWYGYADIAAILGRSKSSIAAYVKELVELDLVEAIEQKTANGFNYRRRLKLVQWGSFLDLWKNFTSRKKSLNDKDKKDATEAKRKEFSVTREHAPSKADARKTPPAHTAVSGRDLASQDTEHRVQQTECKDPTGPINKIHQNQTPAATAPVVWSADDEISWRRFRPSDNDPISVAHGKPCPALVEKLELLRTNLRQRAGLLAPEVARNEAQTRLEAFACKHGLKYTRSDLQDATEALSEIASTQGALDAAMQELEAIWKPYWHQMPTTRQIKKSLETVAKAAGPSRELRDKISQVQTRLWAANLHAGKRRARNGCQSSIQAQM
jgi:hypothetical protein